jgi:hypothetical protein
LRDELTLPLAAIIANQVVPPIFAEAERTALAELEEPAAADAASSALAAGIRRAAREKVQAESLRRLESLGAPILHLPFLPEGAGSASALSKLTDALSL